ncbi:hypothetical protein [Prevotella disiens]|uniref:hypothetical protein n=1 Tax=Prevotella disiens TaxID=28130 RepID=UPI00336A57D5
MNKKIFKISKFRGEILNWSFGIGVALMLLKFFENFGNKLSESSEVLSTSIDNMVGDRTLLLLLTTGITVCSLLMWEQLRHALLKTNHFWLQLVQIVVMVLTAFAAIVWLIPGEMFTPTGGSMTMQGGGVAASSLLTFQTRVSFLTTLFVSAANVLLGFGLVRFFTGNIRRYGVALLIVPLLDMMLSWLFGYLYTSVGGLTFQTLENYRTLMLAGQLLLQVGLYVCLRFAFTTETMEDDDENAAVLYKYKQE